MNPPPRKPHYFDGANGGWRAPDQAARHLLGQIASHAGIFHDWVIENTGAWVEITLLDHQPEQSTRIGFTCNGAAGELIASAHAGGWVQLTARVSGQDVFSAFAEQPYEEYELWSGGAPPADESREAPGRASKKMFWICLSAAAWPALRPVANGDTFITIAIDENRLRQRDVATEDV